MTNDPIAIEVRLDDSNLDQARARVTQALADEGFGILTEIDVRATLKKKLDLDFRPYVILGACNPKLAHRALSEEPSIGVLLPCNVVIETDDEGVLVRIADPKAMFQVIDNEAVAPVAEEAEARLRRVAQALSG